MSVGEELACGWFICLNLWGWVLMGIDKGRAKKGRWRVPESRFFWIAGLGGALGIWLGMRLWHHKTLHASFRWGIPLLLLAWVALTALWFAS
jgi:uncharacterized membrane protein YsdA (DUF1294 family)